MKKELRNSQKLMGVLELLPRNLGRILGSTETKQKIQMPDAYVPNKSISICSYKIYVANTNTRAEDYGRQTR